MISPEEDLAFLQLVGEAPHDAERPDVELCTIEEFSAQDEAGAEPLLGAGENILIPEGGDIMFYGDGGAGKTSLTLDAAFHLGTGTTWLGIPVPHRRRVLIIEAEGPRPLLRRKLRRKLDGWSGPNLDEHVRIVQAPWAAFTFASDGWRTSLAEVVRDHATDVLIAGPLTRIGMDGAGTLQEVVGFMALVNDVRERSGRRLTVILVHHENKGGAVSGAWEGAGDTLVHVQAAGPGHTVMHVQKARWSSAHHGQSFKLQWTESGDGFVLEDDRDLLGEIVELLQDQQWRTVQEIRETVGAGTRAVEAVLKTEHPDRFQMRTGEAARALGRRATAQLYQVAP